jgi:hypothetical protein
MNNDNDQGGVGGFHGHPAPDHNRSPKQPDAVVDVPMDPTPVPKEVWEVDKNWTDSKKGDISQHLTVICEPTGGFVSITRDYMRTHRKEKIKPGHTAAMILLDPPYLSGDRMDTNEIMDWLKACSTWANDGCVLIIFIDWMQATPWCDALKKLAWVVESSQLVIKRRNSK